MLIHRFDSQLASPMCRQAVDALTAEPNLAFIRLVEPAEDLDQRAFAGAVVADETGQLAWQQLERHTVQRHDAAEVLGNIEAANERFCGRFHDCQSTWGELRPAGARPTSWSHYLNAF